MSERDPAAMLREIVKAMDHWRDMGVDVRVRGEIHIIDSTGETLVVYLAKPRDEVVAHTPTFHADD